MDRLWRMFLLMDIVLWTLWWFAAFIPMIQPPRDTTIFYAALFSTGFTVFAFFVRNMSYVQAHRDHIAMVTPFLRMKISFQRLQSIRPVDFGAIFEWQTLSWADRRFMRPYHVKTVVALLLNDYPIAPSILHFFLPKQIFLPQGTGFWLLIADWVSFNTEVDSFLHTWRDTRRPRVQNPSLRGITGKK